MTQAGNAKQQKEENRMRESHHLGIGRNACFHALALGIVKIQIFGFKTGLLLTLWVSCFALHGLARDNLARR
jgi:hypothetical protein